MKKKVFFQVSIILYILLAFIFALFAACVSVIVWFLANNIQSATPFGWIGFCIIIFSACFLGYTFLRFAKNRIILDEQEIYIPGNWGGRAVKLQYETHISYTEITDVFFVSSSNNSLNKSLKWGTLPMPYIVFECKDGSQKSVNVFYYSKRQVALLVDECILRAKELGNDLNLPSGQELIAELIAKDKNSK